MLNCLEDNTACQLWNNNGLLMDYLWILMDSTYSSEYLCVTHFPSLSLQNTQILQNNVGQKSKRWSCTCRIRWESMVVSFIAVCNTMRSAASGVILCHIPCSSEGIYSSSDKRIIINNNKLRRDRNPAMPKEFQNRKFIQLHSNLVITSN